MNRKLLVLGASFVAIGYIYSIATASIGLMMFLLSWILNFKDLEINRFFKYKCLWLPIVFYLFTIISLTYSLDFQQGTKIVVRYLSFILIPIVFLTIRPFNKKERMIIVRVFIISVGIFHLLCFSHAVYRQVVFSLSGGPFNWYFFFRYDLLEIFNQHPTYVALFTLMSISFLLFYSEGLIFKRKFSLLLIPFQIIGLFFSGSRIGVIILFVLLLLFLYKNVFIHRKRPKIKSILIFSTSFTFILVFLWSIPIIKERVLFTFGYNYNYKFNKKEHIENGAPEKEGRFLLWQDALELVIEKPIIGYGTGSNYVVLRKKYEQKGHISFLEQNFNAHNTYLEVLISGGFLHLCIFLLMICTIFFEGWKKKNFILLSFFCIICLTALTESIFRAQGIIFFVFFYCFVLNGRIFRRSKQILIIGPYPPPVGGISLFMKKLVDFIRLNFEVNVLVLDEFGISKDKRVLRLSNKSKSIYLIKLIWYLFTTNNEYVYYNGVHGITRFVLTIFSKIIRFKLIFHLHGQSAYNFHLKNSFTQRVSIYSLNNSDLIVAVNNSILEKLNFINSKVSQIVMPAYITDKIKVNSIRIDQFISDLPLRRKYFLSYGTLDKTKEGIYNYGINELIEVFNSKEIVNSKISLIFVLILYKREHIEEYNSKLEACFSRNNNIKVFINDGGEPLTPFFRKVEGYIRFTHEDGLGVSLFEAMEHNIAAMATTVCERPDGVILFSNKDTEELKQIILANNFKYKSNHNIRINSEYLKLFKKIGLKPKNLIES